MRLKRLCCFIVILTLLGLMALPASFGEAQKEQAAGKDVNNEDLIELWKAYRGFENAYRYYSDFLASLIKHLEEKEVDVSIPSGKLGQIKRDWPNSCHPPWCFKSPMDWNKETKDLSKRMTSLAKITEELVNQIQASGRIDINEKLEFYGSELPGTRFEPQRGGGH